MNEQNKQLNILVIDDDIPMTNTLSMMVKRIKMNPFSANTPQEALDIWINQNIDIIVCDFHISYMLGPTLISSLKDTKPLANTKIVYISGDVYIKEELTKHNTHYHAILAKPFTIQEFSATISSLSA